jgi:hypothetical protein
VKTSDFDPIRKAAASSREGSHGMKISSLFLSLAFAATGLTISSGLAKATVTEFTSQAAFNAAAPHLNTYGFYTGGATSWPASPLIFHGLSFSSNVTAADIANGGSPVLSLISVKDNSYYGRDFLEVENTNVGLIAEIDSAGTRAIGFTFGNWLTLYGAGGSATVTLSTGDSFIITPTFPDQFIGFTSTTPITSVTIDYPASFGAAGYALDITSVTTVPETSTWAMMLVGFAGLGFAGYRRSKKNSAVRAA